MTNFTIPKSGRLQRRYRRRMTACAAVCATLLLTPAIAGEPDEAQIGPVDYQQNVNGVAVNLSATTYVKIETIDNKLYLRARVVGDLIDLQRKIGPIVDTFDLPRDNCGSYSPKNAVVSIPRKELRYAAGGAVFSIGGSVTMWQCIENLVPNSRLDWEVRNIGLGIKAKVPVIRTWPGSPIKTILVRQSFDADLPVFLVKNSDHAVGVQFSKPDIELKGDLAFITKGALQIAGVDINQKAYDALQKAIDPQKLQLAIPDELAKYNPTVVSARLIDQAGHLCAELTLSALVPAATVTELVKELIARKKA